MQKERYRSWIDYNGNFELIDYESNQYITSLVKLDDLLNQQDKENKQLKQSQKQLAISELEKVAEFLLEKIAEKQSCFDSGNYNDFADGVKTICEILLDDIHKKINKLRG